MGPEGISALQFAAEEMTFGQRGIESAKVILTGFVVVFAVLLLLIGIIKLYSMIINKIQNHNDRRKQVEAPVQESVSDASLSAAPARSPEVEDGIPEEVVAVIAAAVASLYGASAKPKIKSIKKSSGGRSAWASAGISDNTRPF